MNVVTGAFGFIGRHIARNLLELGEGVRTITTHPTKPNPFGPAVQAFPYHFDRPDRLTEILRGATTLYNTYWIRFEYGQVTFEEALRNTAVLLACAKQAGVRKVVHISVTHASEESPLAYYRGKGLQELLVRESCLDYGIVRPTIVFGPGDILVNNIAWLIRRFPVFPVFGSGRYRVQPVYVGDLARIAVSLARNSVNVAVDAIGPETFTFREFAQRLASAVRPGRLLLPMPPALGILLGGIIGRTIGDVLLTRDELEGLMANLLTSDQPSNGTTRFSDWLAANKNTVGRTYASEIRRHYAWRDGGWTGDPAANRLFFDPRLHK